LLSWQQVNFIGLIFVLNLSALPFVTTFTTSLNKLPKFSLLNLPLSLRCKVINVMPKILRPAFSLLPFTLQQKALLPALHSVFNEAIADGDFEFLQYKWLKITIIDLNLQWLISFRDGKLIMADANSHANNHDNKLNPEYDVSFSATAEDLLLIAGRKQDPDTLFFQRRLKIEGDTELGLEVKNLIDAIELEQLPSLIHQFVELCANLVQQTREQIADTSNESS